MSSLVIDNIGLLVTNEPELGGAARDRRDAAVVCEDGRGRRGRARGRRGRRRIDAGGRCVIPGFVDSHTHWCSRAIGAEEFAARMAGAPYAAGGSR